MERKAAESEVALHLLVLYVDVEPERKKMMDIWAEIWKHGLYDIRRELLEALLTTFGPTGWCVR